MFPEGKNNLKKPTTLGDQPLFERKEESHHHQHFPKLSISKSTASLKSFCKRTGSDFSV